MNHKFQSVFRDGLLTPEQASRDEVIRRAVEVEFPRATPKTAHESHSPEASSAEFPNSVDAESESAIGFDVSVWNAADINGYLSEHPTLRSLLPRICEQARSEFGRDAELTLELYRDPEIDDRYLTLLVRQTQYEANVVERLDQLTVQFADELGQCTGDLLVTTDFRPTR